MVNEMVKCRGSIRAIEFAILLFLIGLILFAVSMSDYANCTKEQCPQEIKDRIIAGGSLVAVAFIIAFIAALNAAYFGCFRTAIVGTLLSLLIVL